MPKMYMINPNEQFRGFHQSVVLIDEASNTSEVLYSDGMSLEAYYEAYPERKDYELVTESEYERRMIEYNNSLITDPVEITRERYWDMLEVLPPCRWYNRGRYRAFHVSERLTNNLVSWFVEDGDKYWEFTDEATLSDSDLRKKMGKVDESVSL